MGTGEGFTLKVYLVEDSAAVRDRLILMLADLGRVEVVGWAGGAAEAVEGCRKLLPGKNRPRPLNGRPASSCQVVGTVPRADRVPGGPSGSPPGSGPAGAAPST